MLGAAINANLALADGNGWLVVFVDSDWKDFFETKLLKEVPKGFCLFGCKGELDILSLCGAKRDNGLSAGLPAHRGTCNGTEESTGGAAFIWVISLGCVNVDLEQWLAAIKHQATVLVLDKIGDGAQSSGHVLFCRVNEEP